MRALYVALVAIVAIFALSSNPTGWLAVEGRVTITDGTKIDQIEPKTALYLRNYGVSVYESRLQVPRPGIMRVPLPRFNPVIRRDLLAIPAQESVHEGTGHSRGQAIAAMKERLRRLRGAQAVFEDQPLKDCSHLGCLIHAAANCTPSRTTHTTETGMDKIRTETITYELLGEDLGKCGLRFTIDSIDLSYTTAYRSTLLDNYSPSEVEAMEQADIKRAETAEGKFALCAIPPEPLASMLQRWRAGFRKLSDIAGYKCSGTLIEPAEPEEEPDIDCESDFDCGAGEHCFKKECMDNDLFDAKNPCQEGLCHEECTDCRKGFFSCLDSPVGDRCVECYQNSHCRPDSVCRKYECIAQS